MAQHNTISASLVGDNTYAYPVIMIRTQISLSQDDYLAAKAEAARLGISLAEYFRRALRAALPVNDGPPWMRFAGMVETGDPHSSNSIDEVVYGHKH